MASRKHLKKSIKLVTSELFTDCIALSLCKQGDSETLDALMAEIIALNADYVSRLSHVERGSERLFFKKLREEFTEKVNDISERIVKA